MGAPTEKRLEWERLLLGHAGGTARFEPLPVELRELLQEVNEKLGTPRRDHLAHGSGVNAPQLAPADEASHAGDRENANSTKSEGVPAAGPHARPELINPDLTPGTGVLPDPKADEPNAEPTG
ncbi:MAG: hypothetical protein ACJ8F3_20600 [Xanthobacteraceae bacterium]